MPETFTHPDAAAIVASAPARLFVTHNPVTTLTTIFSAETLDWVIQTDCETLQDVIDWIGDEGYIITSNWDLAPNQASRSKTSVIYAEVEKVVIMGMNSDYDWLRDCADCGERVGLTDTAWKRHYEFCEAYKERMAREDNEN